MLGKKELSLEELKSKYEEVLAKEAEARKNLEEAKKIEEAAKSARREAVRQKYRPATNLRKAIKEKEEAHKRLLTEETGEYEAGKLLSKVKGKEKDAERALQEQEREVNKHDRKIYATKLAANVLEPSLFKLMKTPFFLLNQNCVQRLYQQECYKHGAIVSFIPNFVNNNFGTIKDLVFLGQMLFLYASGCLCATATYLVSSSPVIKRCSMLYSVAFTVGAGNWCLLSDAEAWLDQTKNSFVDFITNSTSAYKLKDAYTVIE
ncbi:MAG: hypothetical protein K0R73_82 [Candidatus Midichloriaceae bacterium]|jgi:hypothetical protein|nr:hypothetical protein [Candidatus Midichloriaceae bacterium]